MKLFRYFFTLLTFFSLFHIESATSQDTILTLKKIVLPDKIKNLSYFISPIIAYNPETRFVFGGAAVIRFQSKRDLDSNEFHRPSTILPSIRYTMNDQMIATFETDIYIKNEYNINLYPRFSKYPDVFFGTGNRTKESNKETFTDENYTLTSTISGIFFKKKFLGLVLDIKDHELFNIEPGKRLDTLNFPGRSGGFYAGIGISFKHDSRDDIFYPTKGYYLNFESVFYPNLPFNRYHFNNILIDYRHLFTIVNKKNIMAFQAFANFTDGSTVPFYELKKIGGDANLRGIHARRYIDKHALYIQAEYRRFLFWRFNAVAFCGMGEVSNTVKEFTADGIRYSYGFGLRYKLLKDEKINLRFDMGFGSDHQYGAYIEIKESF